MSPWDQLHVFRAMEKGSSDSMGDYLQDDEQVTERKCGRD